MNAKYQGYSFPLRDTVQREKVRFHNRYGIELVGDLYLPMAISGKLAAVAVAGPFGAVKEQCAGLYAEELASRGFAALAFDPSFIGESGGQVRNVASPDINTEDFSAAVDFLSTREFIDPDKVGILGICGWGGMALNAAAMDTRIKATVTSTMYDMTRVNAKGYFDSADSADARYETKKALNAQRTVDYQNGTYARAGGVVDPLPEDAPFFVKDYYDYYKTERGYTERSLNSNDGWNTTSSLSFLNMPILRYSNEIRSAVLMIHGEKAHSCYFSRDAYADMVKNSPYAGNKDLLIIPGAVHTDLYDQKNIIVEEVTGIPLLRPIAVHLNGLLRPGRNEPRFPLPIEIGQVDAAGGDAAAQGSPQPVLTLGVILPQIALDGVVAVEILPGLALNFREISPVVGVTDDHLTQRLPVLRLVQHNVKGLLKTQGHGLGQLPVHHPAAQGQQRSDGAAFQHGAAHQLVPRFLVRRKPVARPGVLRAVQAPGQQATGVCISSIHGLFQQAESLCATLGTQIIVDIFERPLHRVTEKLSHTIPLLCCMLFPL